MKHGRVPSPCAMMINGGWGEFVHNPKIHSILARPLTSTARSALNSPRLCEYRLPYETFGLTNWIPLSWMPSGGGSCYRFCYQPEQIQHDSGRLRFAAKPVKSYGCVISDHLGLRLRRTENPCVGGSIPPLATCIHAVPRASTNKPGISGLHPGYKNGWLSCRHHHALASTGTRSPAVGRRYGRGAEEPAGLFLSGGTKPTKRGVYPKPLNKKVLIAALKAKPDGPV
jgi:hypothetical protein